ncbi:helix-turn-helix domain-containing protein [Roseomonas terrae]|jgi:DNA-binding IclR family transcriptional regulator|uniref:Helix-turn-helix domain-containing protein n=1 Tax=Neoroseomonas terrae TaxID=424799 RepID=A0ABS5EBK1_9PROT|nr:helix-turn-helix domain-containing protein [Neoroseomonas terrae]MBR0648335.1 helix-turn-helix domain-containing protein [Neoroseomonas terrae]
MTDARDTPGVRAETAGGVIAVDRAIDLLDAFRWGDDGLSLAELANRTGLHKTTILRLAVSLQAAGMLARSIGGEFRLGANILKLSAILRASQRLDREAQPFLEKLAAECRESASLFIRDGEARICLARAEAEQSVRDAPRRLLPLALDDTSAGLVLRGLEGNWVGEAGTPFRPIFTSGVTDPQTASLSAPVFDAEGDIVGSMTVSGPAFRLTAEIARQHAPKLAVQAEAFSASLGYRAEMPPTRSTAPRKERRASQTAKNGTR